MSNAWTAEMKAVEDVIWFDESRHFNWWRNVLVPIAAGEEVSHDDHTYGVYADALCIFASLMEKEE